MMRHSVHPGSIWAAPTSGSIPKAVTPNGGFSVSEPCRPPRGPPPHGVTGRAPCATLYCRLHRLTDSRKSGP